MFDINQIKTGDRVEFAEDDGRILTGTVEMIIRESNAIFVRWDDDYHDSPVSLRSSSLIRVGRQTN